MKTSEKIIKIAVILFASTISVLGSFSFLEKVDNFFREDSLTAIAADITQSPTVNHNISKSSASTSNYVIKEETQDTAEPSDDFEQTYLVTESLYRESNMSYDNFYVKNATELSLDLGTYLHSDLPFEFDNPDEPQVLIVHTHATESYMAEDAGYYYESYSPRNNDDQYNVVRVGEEITQTLERNGIKTLHCLTHHDEPSYLGAYDNCAESILSYLAEYPTIKLVLDIHRDSITTDDGEKIKPTFIYNNKKAAQIMIMCGNDNNGYYDFPNWRENMNLAVKLQQMAESKFPGMTRPLYFGNFMYNMNLAEGSLLIEIGTDANTLDEAVYSGEMLGEVIADVINKS